MMAFAKAATILLTAILGVAVIAALARPRFSNTDHSQIYPMARPISVQSAQEVMIDSAQAMTVEIQSLHDSVMHTAVLAKSYVVEQRLAEIPSEIFEE
jgi:hypothetical protein